MSVSAINVGDTDDADVIEQDLSEMQSRDAMLVVRRGPNVGARFLLDHDIVTTGRHPNNDIFLDDVTVSRKHAEFRRDNGRFEVVDVGSMNGTYVNGARVDATALNHGDEVQIGTFKLLFLSGQG